MRSSLLAVLTIALATARPLALKDDVYAKGVVEIKDLLGEGANIAAATAIIADEAAALGISTEHHWKACFDFSVRSSTIEAIFYPRRVDDITDEDEEEMTMELAEKSHLLTLKHRDQIFPALRKQLPKTHEYLVKMVGENFKEYDEEMEAIGDEKATAFMMRLKNSTLDVIVKWTQAKGDGKQAKQFLPVVAKALYKMMKEWSNLPKTSKIAMEKQLCLQTTMRLYDELAEEKGRITEMKEQINTVIGELVEKQIESSRGRARKP